MLSILILSEDGGKHAHKTVVALAKRMLRVVDEHCQIHDERAFEPPEDEAALIARGNRWKSTNPRDRQKVVSLVRSIATKLAEEAGMVMFHVDGDRPWSQRYTSENRQKLDDIILTRVRALLAGKHREWSIEDIDRRMQRLFILMPFYSIEAWLYQNTSHAIRICQEQYGGRHVERFQEWQANRALLDEVEQIKDAICLGDKHNLELASSAFPHEVVFLAGTSFAAAVDALCACHELRAALARTYQV